jgi:tetratricopeptide (TPR) repeat protein
LALGGAFAAIADDASAVVWNAGGLGFVQRREFQASHSNLIGMGFNEQYASLVLPSWRWGVTAVTFRRFGVDQIEERDDRNQLLNNDLSDSEMELALAYGRQLSPAWSVGGAFKLQRQSLAGFTGTGLGLDLGLLCRPILAAGSSAPWAQNLTLGFAVRNAIQPAIRLDQESVSDPTGLRGGIAYSQPLGSEGKLMGTVDVEKTSDMDAHLHAGLEWQINSILALRTGVNQSTFTAGTGIRWRDIGIDYTFEDIPEKSVHRFGISFAFGHTVTETRLAVQAAEEERLQVRLTEAFAEHNRKRILEFLGNAEMALSDEKFDEALEILAMVKILDPENEKAGRLEVMALLKKGAEFEKAGDYAAAVVTYGRALAQAPNDPGAIKGLARVRSRSDREEARSAEIRQALDTALDAFAQGNLIVAQEGFQSVLNKNPGDKEASAMLRRTNEVIQNRTVELVGQAQTLIRAGQLQEARTALDRARELDPATPDLELVTSALAATTRQKALKESTGTQVTTEEEKPIEEEDAAGQTGAIESAATASLGISPTTDLTRPLLTEEKQREIADLYRRGLVAMERQAIDEAIHYWELVWSADPGYQNVSDFLKEEYLTRGMEAFVSGELHRAVNNWERALRVDPADPRAQGYLRRAKERLTRIQVLSDESDGTQ